MNKSPSKFSFDKDPLIISIRKDCQLFSYACIDHASSRNDLYQRSLDLHSQMNQLVHVTRVNRALEKQIDFKTKLVKELQTALYITDACDAFVRDVDNKELFQQKTFPSTKSYKNMNKSPSKFSFDKDPLIISIRKDCQLFSMYQMLPHRQKKPLRTCTKTMITI
ncbi:uncharacterized protein LOC144002489 [Festucalex cinctus]